VATELAHGCYIGPLDPAQLPFPVAVTPLGAVPKVNSTRFHIITDCTYSEKGINHWIPKQWYRGKPHFIKLPTVDSIVAGVKKVRLRHPGARIVGFKVDIARFFQNLGIDPGQSPYLAVLVDHLLYLDHVHS
jgi:hypothetical protein